MHSLPELSIIFVNWNSSHYLRACLASIYSATSGLDFDVIVVDNGSPSDDADQLKREFPGINLLKSKENLGFARANNLGFKSSAGRYVLFLNPDTRVIGLAIPTMLARLKSLPDAGIIGCRLLNSDLSIQTACIQRFPTVLNQVLNIELLRVRWPACKLWRIEPLFSDREEPSEVEVVSGACLMIRRDVFETVGLFSEDYFMYAEDVDLCFKIHKTGLKIYYVGDASVIHYGHGSTKQRDNNQWVAITQRKAIMQFCRKTRGPLYAWMYRVVMGVAAICRLTVMVPLLPLERIATEKQRLYSASRKWAAVLKWAIGLDDQAVRSS